MAPTWNSSTLSHLHREVTLLPCYFSPFQRHHYRSLNDISFTFPCNIHALLLFSSFCHTFPLRNDRSRAQRISVAWHISSFTQLHTETALHPASPLFFCGRSPLVVFAPSTAAYTFRFAYRTVFAVFCVFCVLCLLVYRVFLRVSSRETIHANFSVGRHSYIVDLPFRITNCRFLLAIVSRSWDLVCINLSFASRDFMCAPNHLNYALHYRFCPSAWTPRFQRVECVLLAHGPRWLFLLSRHRKAFLLLLIRSLL